MNSSVNQCAWDIINSFASIYYFVFVILMYNVWRLADVLLKVTVTREIIDYTPTITTGELTDWFAIHLQEEPD